MERGSGGRRGYRQPALRDAGGGSVAEQHHLRHRQRLRVRDCDQRPGDLHGVRPPGSATVQVKPWRAPEANDFDVFPEHALRLTGAKRLHGRLLDRKSPGQMRSRIPTLGTISNLTGSKHPVEESFTVAVEQFGDTGNVGGVEADAKDVHDRTTA